MRKFSKVNIESLENRVVPANVVFNSGILTISSQVGTLVTSTTSTNAEVSVVDNATNQTYNGVTAINIVGTSSADTICFRADLSSFAGSLTISSKNGDDVIDLSGRVTSNVSVDTNSGNDTITFTNNNFDVFGNFKFLAGSGSNTFDMNGRNFSVNNGNVTISDITFFSMGSGSEFNIGGNVQISTNTGFDVNFDGFLFGCSGDVIFTSNGSSDDSITLSNATYCIIEQDLSINLGSGDNTVQWLTSGILSEIYGSFTYIGGSHEDSFELGGDEFIAGHVSIDLGDGDNTFTDALYTQYRSLSIMSGHGDDTISVLGLTPVDLFVSNGDGSDVTNIETFMISSGLFTYWAGDGTDVLNIDCPYSGIRTINIDAIFGNGNQTLNLLGSGWTLTGSLIGTGGTYTFNPGIVTDLTVKSNYP
jgi:hypothetical protein